jgi:hypothetical protein
MKLAELSSLNTYAILRHNGRLLDPGFIPSPQDASHRECGSETMAKDRAVCEDAEELFAKMKCYGLLCKPKLRLIGRLYLAISSPFEISKNLRRWAFNGKDEKEYKLLNPKS